MNSEQLQKENDALKAYFERTKDLLNAVGHVGVDIGYGVYELGRSEIEQARELFHETPSQSLNHILSQVEEETIERFKKLKIWGWMAAAMEDETVCDEMKRDISDAFIELHDVTKYKEQSNKEYQSGIQSASGGMTQTPIE